MNQDQTFLYEKNVFRAQQGDKKALSLLCEDAMKSSYFIALKILKNEKDAEDVVSDTMLTIVKKIGELKEPKSFSGWVNRIVINKCNDYMKKKKPVLYGNEAEIVENGELEGYDTEFLPEEYVINEEKRKIIMDIIREKTSETEMMTILMFYYNGDSIATIAKTMDCAEITVKKRLASARKKIKDAIENSSDRDSFFVAVGTATALGDMLKKEAAKGKLPANAQSGISKAVNKAIESSANTGAKLHIKKGTAITALSVAGVCIITVIICVYARFGINGNENIESGTGSVIVSQSDINGSEEDYSDENDNDESRTDESENEKTNFDANALERYTVEDLGFTAPSVHTEANEECKFLWNYTEEDVKNWYFDKKYTDENNTYYYSDNTTGNLKFDSRTVRYVTAYSTESNESAKISITSEGYNETVVSGVEFSYNNTDLNAVIDEVEKFIEYMGFKDYANDIIHSDSVIDIPVENGLGKYGIITSYFASEYDLTYELSVSFKYFDDVNYEEYLSITPITMEQWSDYNEIAEWFPDSKFSTASLESFFMDIGKYIKENVYKDVSNLGFSEQTYSYVIKPGSNVRQEEKAMIYYLYHEQKLTEPLQNYHCQLTFDGDSGDTELYTSLFTGTDKTIANELSDSEIDKMCSARLSYLKNIVPSIDFTKDYLVKKFRNYELNEENDVVNQTYEKGEIEYDINNLFDTLVIKANGPDLNIDE